MLYSNFVCFALLSDNLKKLCSENMELQDEVKQALYHFQTVITEALKRHGTQPHSIFTIGDIVRQAVHHALDILAPMSGKGHKGGSPHICFCLCCNPSSMCVGVCVCVCVCVCVLCVCVCVCCVCVCVRVRVCVCVCVCVCSLTPLVMPHNLRSPSSNWNK